MSDKIGKSEAVEKIGHFRWSIVALLFSATTINYIDRQVLGILAPVLQKEIGWNEIDYGYIVTAFQAAYAIGLVVVGGLIDKFGTKIGYSLAIFGWSIASMFHAAATSVIGFATARFALGLSEAGNFPAAIKTVAEWFPKKERAFATGIFNSGSNIGAIAAPLVVPWITITYGWQEAFIATGALGFIWLILWWVLYEKPEHHKRLKKPELDYILSDPAETSVKIPWLQLIKYKQTWAFAIAKFLTDPIWWFYLYWIPKFLFKNYGITLDQIGPPLIIIYVMADVGSIGGGWLSSFFIKRGFTVNKGRKAAMLIMALCVVPIVFASQASEMWIAVMLLSIATAAHQGWSANLFTTVSDLFPKKAVASVVGFGGMAGAIGGMMIATFAGFILQLTGSYVWLFIISGSVYLIAFFIFNLLAPHLEPIKETI
ncbi:MAG: MFS transporter [Ignavibacteria bacterium CG22_combo_CG10-13_8_21_14_all_37_15]|nr:MAG: MFS transporter [Ignavibacteria bacterium CG22_combo_CG10-13_8_21_14_all_37_15]